MPAVFASRSSAAQERAISGSFIHFTRGGLHERLELFVGE
jgi:hypothetical protein